MDEVLRNIWSAIKVAWAFVWNWWFLCAANALTSLWSLVTVKWHPSMSPIVACDLDNPAKMYFEGWVKQQGAGIQAGTSFLALVNNIPDFTAPGVLVLLAGMWGIRGIRDNAVDNADLLRNVASAVVFLVSLWGIAATYQFQNEQATKQANAGLTYLDNVLSIEDIGPLARKVAIDEPSAKPPVSFRACSFALEMLTTERLGICSRSNIVECFKGAQQSPERMEVIDAAMKKWLFKEEESKSPIAASRSLVQQ